MSLAIVLPLCLTPTLPADVLPAPVLVASGRGAAAGGASIACREPVFEPAAEALVAALTKRGALHARLVEPGAADVVFERDAALAREAYSIDWDERGVVIRASGSTGAAHAASSLLQLAFLLKGEVSWPRRAILDAPDVPYRSFMVDMGRNPHSPETLRQVVDMMWLCKANLLQLHLGDDQLWSWPSEAFPKLQSANAGWTREDFATLWDYARARGVTIVPELEAPGHSGILRREYPEVFGETTTDLATLPSARAGLVRLIDELLEAFPSPYLHIGGDEAYGVPEEAQRDLINFLNRHLRARGVRTCVWEGPKPGTGDNKVDTDVLHLNWRTIEFPAQDMLDQGYEVVNAAWDPLYVVDHYPRTMFTAVDLERCYDLDLTRFAHVNHGMPTFANPHRTRNADGILGFCMPWWEGREENLLDLCLPRLFAASCAAWNRAGERDFESFLQRLTDVSAIFEAISGATLTRTPFAPAESQTANLAYRAAVTSSRGAHQPPFGPERLTNGIPDPFDHFLGYPTQPDPLEITITLRESAEVSRIRIHERAVGGSHELYELFVSADGEAFELVGSTTPDSRGDEQYVDHVFAARPVSAIRIRTRGCHGLTFPSFSRLSEVMAFEE